MTQEQETTHMKKEVALVTSLGTEKIFAFESNAEDKHDWKKLDFLLDNSQNKMFFLVLTTLAFST